MAVARFARRFPNAPELPLLRRRSWDAALRRVLLAEPLGQWRALALKAYEMAGRRRLEGLIRACERRPAACAELRRLARAALPWRPAERLPELVAWSRGADPRREWEALAKLAWVDEAAAYEALIAAVGSSRLDRTWLALRSLRQSLQRGASGQLRRWLQRRYAKAVAGANPDRTQVRAAIDGLFGRREQALAELRRLRKHPAHATSASYLQVVFGRSEGPRLSALLAALRKRLGQLEQAFPGQLGPDNLGVARIAEQGLVMVERVFGDAAASAVEAVARHPLARRIARLLLAWRQKIRRIDAAFVSSSIPDYEIVASAHERQRGASFAALERARGPLARALLLAVCAVHEAGAMQARRPGCPAQVKASGPKR